MPLIDKNLVDSALRQVPILDSIKRAAHVCGIAGFQYRSSRAVDQGYGLAIFTDHLSSNKANFLKVFDEHGILNQRLP